jgi:hypothetical protein
MVPAGAVTGDAQASATKQTKPADPPSSAWPDRAVGPAYHFDLGGATIAQPVTLTLPFDAASLPQGATPEDLVLAYHDETTGSWVPVPSSVDAATGTVTARVSHLSDWALWTPDWDYWLALLKADASGNITDYLHALTTFVSGCQTADGPYTVDNSLANRMIQGCLTKTSASGATLEIRNLRAFALEVSDPRGYISGQPVLLAPGDSVAFDVAATDASPVVVQANMSFKGLTASVVDIVLGLVPNISGARVSAAWRPAFKEIVDTVDKLHALTNAVTEAEAGHYPQAAEAAVKAITGIDFLTTLAVAARTAGVKFGIPALAQINPAVLNRVMAVVGLGDLIVTTWSFVGDYLLGNAQTEVHLIWASEPGPTPTPTPTLAPAPAKLLPPAAPTGVAHSQEFVDDPQQVIGGHDTVSWNAAGEPPGTTITVAGTLRCLAPEGSPEGTSCLALHTSFAASDLVILGVVPADVGHVTWDFAYGIGPGCFGMTTTLTQQIFAVVVWANNDAGQSRAIIAGTPANVVGWGATC